jgi:cyclase
MCIAKWFLLLLPFVAAGICAQTPASAPPAPSLPFTVKPLGHNVYAAIDDAKGDAGANAGFVIGDDGVAVIDTFENIAAAQALLGEIRKLTNLPVKFVINTHYHLDHVAGNRIFADTGAVVFAHRNARSWIHTENLKFFGNDIKPEQAAMVNALLAPNVVYDDGVTLYLGSRRIDVHFFAGHTGGDSVVVIPDADVAFFGDLFWRNTLPNLIDASTNEWSATLATFTHTPFFSPGQYVPGHGDVGTVNDLIAFRAYLVDLHEIVAAPAKDGKQGDALVNAVLPALKEKYGKWDFFEDFARTDIIDMAAEIQGRKRVPTVERK